MKTISQLAALFNQMLGDKITTSTKRQTQTTATVLDTFAKAQGYTITITPPLTVAAWRIEMQRICRVLLDIAMVDASGLTEHEYAHNAKLRQLWQDKADRLRAAYPGNSTFDVWGAKQMFDATSAEPPRRDIKRERTIMRAGIANGLVQAKNNGQAPLGGWPDAVIDMLLEKVQS